MNKITASGLLGQAQAGRLVLVVSATEQHARHAAFDFAEFSDDVTRVLRAKGDHRIEFKGGGSIRFLSAQSARERGATADLVFIDWDAEAADPMIADRYMPCIAGRPGGEIIRA